MLNASSQSAATATDSIFSVLNVLSNPNWKVLNLKIEVYLNLARLKEQN